MATERVNALQSLMFKSLELPSRYLLSPLAGYTNLPFRAAVRELVDAAKKLIEEDHVDVVLLTPV